MIIINFLISSLNNYLSYIVEEFITQSHKLIKSIFSLFKSAFGGYLFLKKKQEFGKNFFIMSQSLKICPKHFFFYKFLNFLKISCKFWDIAKKIWDSGFFSFLGVIFFLDIANWFGTMKKFLRLYKLFSLSHNYFHSTKHILIFLNYIIMCGK